MFQKCGTATESRFTLLGVFFAHSATSGCCSCAHGMALQGPCHIWGPICHMYACGLHSMEICIAQKTKRVYRNHMYPMSRVPCPASRVLRPVSRVPSPVSRVPCLVSCRVTCRVSRVRCPMSSAHLRRSIRILLSQGSLGILRIGSV